MKCDFLNLSAAPVPARSPDNTHVLRGRGGGDVGAAGVAQWGRGGLAERGGGLHEGQCEGQHPALADSLPGGLSDTHLCVK